MIIGLQRLHRFARDARDILIAQLVIVAQVEGYALLGGQCEQCLLEHDFQFIAIQRGFGLELFNKCVTQ